MSADSQDFTAMLHAWRGGDQAAANQLIEVAYNQMRDLAANYMRHERPDHTLQPTALVHELYGRLFTRATVDWQDRAHFFAVAARQLRRILVNHARDRRAGKRGAGAVRVSLTDINGLTHPLQEDVLAVDEALGRLEQLDARAAHVVELRFFGGLDEKEAAAVLGISVATLKRDWDFARAWLLAQLEPGAASPTF